MKPTMDIPSYLKLMEQEWDSRARQNALHFIANERVEWSLADFIASGRQTVEQDILTDMGNICQGRNPKEMRVLELGCGAGRVTTALAQIFGEVHGVDISSEMLDRAALHSRDLGNIFFHKSDGSSLAVLGDEKFDFAYSCCVFHHISSYEVIESYVRDVRKHLFPGALFKFEVQGCQDVRTAIGDTWIGVPFSEQQALDLAARTGFDARFRIGVGQERFWLWFFALAEA